jgi:N-acetyl-gamma-glutamyl-phosphate reductase
MKYRVFVDGQEGTTGLRINELLAGRDDLEVLHIESALRKDPVARARLLNAADIAFLCLPDDAARAAVELVTNPKTCVIDASTAHRTAPGWAFGLPELVPGQRDHLRAAKRIANPGCHATAFILLLRPLIDAGLLAPDALLSATSVTGYSGGGKKMIEQYEAGGDRLLESPRQYGLTLAHKHVPEMMTHTGLTQRPLFMPIVANFYKGLAVSVPLHFAQLAPRVDGAALREALAKHYAGERFVRVLPLGAPAGAHDGFLDVQTCNDSNDCELMVFASDSQAVLIARLDNLGKGASGAAVQAMNLHLGLEEQTGLVVAED